MTGRGYGQLSIRTPGAGRAKHPVKELAHRAMEEIMRGENEFDLDDDPLGPIFYIARPDLEYDETIDHLCYNRRCVNPDHWSDPVTRAENSRLMQLRRKK